MAQVFVALCHVCAKESVICAIVRGTGYVAKGGTITDYVYAVALYVTLSLSDSFFLWHRKKRSASHLHAHVRALKNRSI